jgi:hypothetical protein
MVPEEAPEMTDDDPKPSGPPETNHGRPWTPSAAERFGGPIGVKLGNINDDPALAAWVRDRERDRPPFPIDQAVRLADFLPKPAKPDEGEPR